MRRIASFVLLLALGGCGYHTWWNPPFTAGNMPNAPAGNSETMRRVMGEPVHVTPLTPQAGDVWPGPLPPTPTLQDLEKQSSLQPLPEQAVPGSPLYHGTAPAAQMPPVPPPTQARGSATPPSPQPAPPPPVVIPPASPSSAAVVPPAKPGPQGKVVHTRQGTGVITGGSPGYQTMTMPNGGSAIVIPNSNGTSTVIHSNGTIETIPTPR